MNMPDAEQVVGVFLRSKLGVHVGTKVPNPRPAEFVRAWRSGGAATSRVLDMPHITVSAWAESSPRAAEIAGAARDALFNESAGMTLVRGVEEVGGLYFDPDPATGIDRYTFTVQLRVRARHN